MGVPLGGQTGPMLTPRQVAALFQVDPKTVTRWCRAGKMTAVRLPGGHYRITRAEVERVIAAGAVPR